MAVNKVVINTENGAQTLIDISDSTVAPNKMLKGTVAYGANGEKVNGTIETVGGASLIVSSALGDKGDTIVINAETEQKAGYVGNCASQEARTISLSVDGNTATVTDGNVSLSKKVADVCGNADASKNINLSGDLADGTYTFIYTKKDGSVVSLGELLIGEPANLFDKNDTDVLIKGRFNSSNGVVTYANGQLVTGYIEAKVGDKFTIKTDKTLKTNGYTGMVVLYNTDKAYIPMGSQIQIGNTATYWTFSDDYLTGEFTVSNTLFNTNMSATAYVRFCVAYTNIDNIVITKS